MKSILLIVILIITGFGSDEKTEKNTNENTVEENLLSKIKENDTSMNTVGEDLLSKTTSNNYLPLILKYLNNEEIKKLKMTSKHFAENMEEWWKIRMGDTIFEIEIYCPPTIDDDVSRRSVILLLRKQLLKELSKDVPNKFKFQLDSDVTFFKLNLEDKYEESALEVGDWVNMNQSIMEKIKTLEEKEQLFSINPDSFYGSQMNKYPVLLHLLKQRDNPTLSQTISFKIQEIIRDDLNEAENLKIQVLIDDALESIHILLNNEFMVLKKGLNFIQKVGGKEGKFEVGDLIEFTDLETLSPLLRACLENVIIPYDSSHGLQNFWILNDDERLLVKDIDNGNNRVLLSFYEPEDVVTDVASNLEFLFEAPPINFTPKNDDFWIYLNEPKLFKKLRNNRKAVQVHKNMGTEFQEESYFIYEGREKFCTSKEEKTLHDNLTNQFQITKDGVYFEFKSFDDMCHFEIHDVKNNKKFEYENPVSVIISTKAYSYPFKFFEL